METRTRPVLTLEPQLAEHAEEMFALLADPAIYEYENDPPESVQALRERFARLEARHSPDGHEEWLNWVIRLPDGKLAGFVQATVRADGSATIAYVLGSAYWGRGIARRAVEMMIAELVRHHGVRRLLATLKRANGRSRRLLERLGFALAGEVEQAAHSLADDELLMTRDASNAPP